MSIRRAAAILGIRPSSARALLARAKAKYRQAAEAMARFERD